MDIQYISVEKEKIDILKKMQKTLVLADDVSHRLCDSSNAVLRVSAPFIDGAQIATHLKRGQISYWKLSKHIIRL